MRKLWRFVSGVWGRLKQVWVKWRLARITTRFTKAWQEANDKMKRAGMHRHERRQFLRQLWKGNVEHLSRILKED